MNSPGVASALLARCRAPRSGWAQWGLRAGLAAYAVACAYIKAPWGILTGLATMGAALYVVPNLRVAFLVFVCFLPSMGEPELDVILPRIWIPPFYLLALAWVTAAVTRPRRVHVDPFLAGMLILFLLTCVVSLMTGVDITACPHSHPWERTHEAVMSSLLMVFAMAAVRDVRDLDRVFRTLVLSGIPLAVTLFFFGAEVEAGGFITRRKGFYASVHPAALHMVVCAIAAATLLRVASSRRERVFLVGCLLLFLSTQHFTSTRTVAATLPIVLIAAVGIEFGLRRALVAGVSLAAGIAVIFPFLPGRLRSNVGTLLSAALGNHEMVMQHFSDGGGKLLTFAGRFLHISEGLHLFSQHPLFGVGIGRHSWMVTLYQASQIHNYYIVVLAETGIIGLTLYLGMVGYSLALGWRCLAVARRRGDRRLFCFTEGLLLTLLAIFIVFCTTPGSATGERFVWPLIGLIAGAARRSAFPASDPMAEATVCQEGGTPA